MASVFKIGDIVQLKSGGPKMTVTNLPDALMSSLGGEKNIIHTSWFAGSKKESGAFPVEALIPVKDEKPK